MQNIPIFVRQFIFDAIVSFVGLVIALNLVIPGSLAEAQAQGLIVLSALGSALAGSFIRNWPAALAALQDFMGLPATFKPSPGYIEYAAGDRSLDSYYDYLDKTARSELLEDAIEPVSYPPLGKIDD
jgi:hypothetical protein